jgi:hypothetical protein
MTLTTGAAFGASCPAGAAVLVLSFCPQAVINAATARAMILSLVYFIDLYLIILDLKFKI